MAAPGADAVSFDARVLGLDGHLLAAYDDVHVCSHGKDGALAHLCARSGTLAARVGATDMPHTVQLRYAHYVMACLIVTPARGDEWWWRHAGMRAHLGVAVAAAAAATDDDDDDDPNDAVHTVVLGGRAEHLYTDVVVVCDVRAHDRCLVRAPACHVLLARPMLVDMASECLVYAHYSRAVREQRRARDRLCASTVG